MGSIGDFHHLLCLLALETLMYGHSGQILQSRLNVQLIETNRLINSVTPYSFSKSN